MHDPRVGRFFAVDPLTAQYPWYTPYSFSGNKVIAYGELEGQEEIIRIVYMNGSKTEIKVSDFKGVQSFNNLRVNTFHSIPNWEILQHQKSRTDFIGWDDYTRSGAGNGQRRADGGRQHLARRHHGEWPEDSAGLNPVGA